MQQHRYVALSLELYGEWSQNEMDRMSSFVAPGDTVLDIGSHIGTLMTAFARYVGDSGRVLAFEPQYEVYRLAVSNSVLNSMSHVRVYNAYVGEKPGTMWTMRRRHNQFGKSKLIDAHGCAQCGCVTGGCGCCGS